MKEIEKYLSPLVESQFPQFYKEQGPLLILFIEEYFKWLESNESNYSSYNDTVAAGNPLFHIRRLLEYKDIDRTLDNFLVYFKEKYLKNIQLNSNVTQRKLIKAAQDLFSSKGSERSLDLLFKLIYGVKIEIFRPGDYILKPSDGTWVIPRYLEISQTTRNVNFPGKQITGSISGATAFVEYIITRNINGRYIDVIFISSVAGNFITGELITDNGIIENAPTLTGSLSSIDLTTSGELFSVGEIVKITSARGVEGLARVSAIEDVTGIVRFNIFSGGWGYSNNATVLISDKVLKLNSNSHFLQYETITQNLYSFSLVDVTGSFSTNNYILNGNATPSLSVTANVVQSSFNPTTANLILNQISGNVFSNSHLTERGKAIIVANTSKVFSLGDVVIHKTGANDTAIGTVSNTVNVSIISVNTSSLGSNGLHVGYYVEQSSTLANGYITLITKENNYTFSNVEIIAVSNVQGTFNNTFNINVYTSNTKATQIEQIDPTLAELGIQYTLINTYVSPSNTGNWTSTGTVIKQADRTVNNSIKIASSVGGRVSTSTNVSATGNNLTYNANSDSIGVIDITNQFYATTLTQVYGSNSNFTANTIAIYSGQNADFKVDTITDIETLRLSTTRITGNNDGPGATSKKFTDILLNGANSGYAYLQGTYIAVSGTGYSNGDVVVFTGGNNALGYQAANGTIVTDNSGSVVSVNLTANVGSNLVSTPAVSVTNASGGSTTGSGANIIPTFSYGFPKMPTGSIEDSLLSLFSYGQVTIGTISTLTQVNPGENYTSNPIIKVYEPEVASFGKRDHIISLTTTAGYLLDEIVEQSIGVPSVTIISNNYKTTGNTNYEIGEALKVSNGAVFGTVKTSIKDLSSNQFTVDIITSPSINVASFTTNLRLIGKTTGFYSNVVSSYSNTSATNAKGRVVGLENTVSGYSDFFARFGLTFPGRVYLRPVYTTTLVVQRLSLFDEFKPTGNINGVTYGNLIGKRSGVSAPIAITTIDSVTPTSPIYNELNRMVKYSTFSGNNAIISGNVTTSNGSISSLEIVSSGFGYVNDENVNLLSLDETRAATGKTNVDMQGVGEGYFSSSRGFLDDNMKLHDGDYYQNYSYEIRTSVPFENYRDIVKEVVHIAGKKFFGELNLTTSANSILSTTFSIVQS